jgi:hypothetical protein
LPRCQSLVCRMRTVLTPKMFRKYGKGRLRERRRNDGHGGFPCAGGQVTRGSLHRGPIARTRLLCPDLPLGDDTSRPAGWRWKEVIVSMRLREHITLSHLSQKSQKLELGILNSASGSTGSRGGDLAILQECQPSSSLKISISRPSRTESKEP